MSSFPDDVVSAVLHHMNHDHADDNVLIVRAFADPAATDARMVRVTHEEGTWAFRRDAHPEEQTVDIRWSTTISERAEIRREIVALYDRACAELGVTPRPH